MNWFWEIRHLNWGMCVRRKVVDVMVEEGVVLSVWERDEWMGVRLEAWWCMVYYLCRNWTKYLPKKYIYCSERACLSWVMAYSIYLLYFTERLHYAKETYSFSKSHQAHLGWKNSWSDFLTSGCLQNNKTNKSGFVTCTLLMYKEWNGHS